MIITTKAPTRISLAGGGTDLPSFYQKHGGIVLSLAINKYQHFDYLETDNPLSVYDPLPPGADRNYYLNTMRELGIETGVLRTRFDGDIQSGLGTSAAAVVGMIGIPQGLTGNAMTREEVAEYAWEIENKKLGLFSGKQDQYAAAYGGINVFEFGDKVRVHPMKQGFLKEVLPYLNLYNLNYKRKDTDLQRNLEVLKEDQEVSLMAIKNMARDAVKSIASGDIEGLALSIQKSWEMKKRANSVSDKHIDKIYEIGMKAGAMAGRLLGSGGGGHMLFLAHPNKRNAVDFEMRFLGVNRVEFEVDYEGLSVEVEKERREDERFNTNGGLGSEAETLNQQSA